MQISLQDDVANLAKSLLEMSKLVYSSSELESPGRSGIIREIESFVATSNGEDQPIRHTTTHSKGESSANSIQHFLQRLNQNLDYESPKTVSSFFCHNVDVAPVAVVSPPPISDNEIVNKRPKFDPPTPRPPLSPSYNPNNALKGFTSKNIANAFSRRRVACPKCPARPYKSHLKYHIYMAHGGPGHYKKSRSVQSLGESSNKLDKAGGRNQYRSVKCQYCNVTTTYCAYTSHLRRVHDSRGLRYACKACLNRFLTVYACIKHIGNNRKCADYHNATSSRRWPTVISGGDEVATADDVGSPMTSRSISLTSSMKRVSNMTSSITSSWAADDSSSSFPCSLCPKAFTTSQDLKVHYGRCHYGG